MPSAVPPNPRAGSDPPDDLDRLLDYDNAVEDFLRDIPVGDDAQNGNTATNDQPRDEDQEVQVRKKRRPVPKLDENLLLTQNGIPKLRKITKTKLKFRGKGHEYADISRLLNTYQLWLDDLYPRAKFRDALTMVEKVGHSKRMQVMRKAWLDDTKPHRREPSPDAEMSGANGNVEDFQDSQRGLREQAERSIVSGIVNDMVGNDPESGAASQSDAPGEDELDALLAESNNFAQPQPKRKGPFVEESDDDDELDALMAEAEMTGRKQNQHNPQNTSLQDPDEDEMDALMAEHPATPPGTSRAANHSLHSLHTAPMENDFADDEEAMASMDW